MHFNNEEKSTNNAYTFYGVDTNWYLDPGATDHIVGELNKLSTQNKYNGQDKVCAPKISCIFNSILHTYTHDIQFNKIIHVPST